MNDDLVRMQQTFQENLVGLLGNIECTFENICETCEPIDFFDYFLIDIMDPEPFRNSLGKALIRTWKNRGGKFLVQSTVYTYSVSTGDPSEAICLWAWAQNFLIPGH